MHYLWALPAASLNVSSFSLEFDRRVLLLGSSMPGLGVIGLSSGEILKRDGKVLNIYQEFMVSGVSASVGLIYMVFEREMYQPQQSQSSKPASGARPYRYEQETLYLTAEHIRKHSAREAKGRVQRGARADRPDSVRGHQGRNNAPLDKAGSVALSLWEDGRHRHKRVYVPHSLDSPV